MLLLIGCGDETGPSAPATAAEESGQRISCGGGPGWSPEAMDGGIEPGTPRAEIEAALRETEQEMGIDGPFRGERTWIVLAEDDDGLTLGTGQWSADGPGQDALVVGYERTGTELDWAGHGECTPLAPVPPAGQDLAEVTAPPDGLDRSASDLTVLVMERQCTSARDPRSFLNQPTIPEQDDRIIVSWTSPWPPAATCPGNPRVEQVLHLDEPLGDRELLDGSTWPATLVE